MKHKHHHKGALLPNKGLRPSLKPFFPSKKVEVTILQEKKPMSAISPPFTRRKHVPSHCKRCGCFEFLDTRHSRMRGGEYSGEEVCLACPHTARQHVWNMIEEKVNMTHDS